MTTDEELDVILDARGAVIAAKFAVLTPLQRAKLEIAGPLPETVTTVSVRKEGPPFDATNHEAMLAFHEENKREEARIIAERRGETVQGPRKAQTLPDAEPAQTDSPSARPPMHVLEEARDAAYAKAQEMGNRNIEGMPASEFLMRQTFIGMKQTQAEIPNDIIKLANEAKHVIVVTHRGVELHRDDVRVMVVHKVDELRRILGAILNTQMLEVLG